MCSQDLHVDSLGETGCFVDRNFVNEGSTRKASEDKGRLKITLAKGPNAIWHVESTYSSARVSRTEKGVVDAIMERQYVKS